MISIYKLKSANFPVIGDTSNRSNSCGKPEGFMTFTAALQLACFKLSLFMHYTVTFPYKYLTGATVGLLAI